MAFVPVEVQENVSSGHIKHHTGTTVTSCTCADVSALSCVEVNNDTAWRKRTQKTDMPTGATLQELAQPHTHQSGRGFYLMILGGPIKPHVALSSESEEQQSA